MKKLLSIIAVIAFVGAMSAPVFASENIKPAISQVADDEPKKETNKKEAVTKTEKKSEGCAEKSTAKACGEEKAKSCGDKDKK